VEEHTIWLVFSSGINVMATRLWSDMGGLPLHEDEPEPGASWSVFLRQSPKIPAVCSTRVPETASKFASGL